MSAILKSKVLYNPISGIYGNAEVEYFFESGNFIVPLNVARIRVRLWGGGGTTGGGGGGFAMKEIEVNSGDIIPVTVGRGGYGSNAATRDGQTSSFGSYVSATGGLSYNTSTLNEGKGIGGDINYDGGRTGATTQEGNAASIFGNGYGTTGTNNTGKWKNYGPNLTYGTSGSESIRITNEFCIDFLGTGSYQSSYNGGASSGSQSSPAGGHRTSNEGGCGLVIVEY